MALIENPSSPASLPGPEAPASPTTGERIDFILGFLRRRYVSVLIGIAAAAPIGAWYYLTTPPSYTATSAMMIETRKGPLPAGMAAEGPPDTAWIESQIGVMKSQNVAAYVVKQLRLAEDRRFTNPEAGPIDRLLARLGWKAAEPKSDEAERTARAIGAVVGGLDVRRIGLSYMLSITFRSHDAELAAKVANAMVDAYVFEQLNAKYQANRRAGDWLQERLQALREQTATAERAVIEFKAKNNIVAAGGGRLMSDQQVGDIFAQLGKARSQGADLQARLDRIDAILKTERSEGGGPVDETISEAMSSGIIGTLRTKYIELMTREADWATRYGKNHIAVANLRREIRDLRKSMFDELARIRESHRSELEISKNKQEELEKQLTGMLSQSQETNQAQVTLFSLEASAQSYRKLYDAFLQRHTESMQQQSYPVSEARQISPAGVSRGGPKPFSVGMMTLFAGTLLGIGLAALREIMDRGFRTREQVRAVLATECLALVPRLADVRARRMLPSFNFQMPFAMPSVRRRPLLTAASAEGAASARHRSSQSSRSWWTVLDAPSSPYAEAIRSIKLTLDLQERASTASRIIGLTSCVPGEGKSTIAVAVATLIAQSGARVILVDADVRNPSLSRSLSPEAKVGFLDVITGKASLADAVWNGPGESMAFLPTVLDPRLTTHVTELLASSAAQSLFKTLQIKYDYVIVDLAPMISAMDVRAATRFVDSFLLVIEWGGTKVDAVHYALRNVPGVQEKVVGAVLNKVDLAAMGRYDSYGGGYYYYYGRAAQATPVN